MNEDLPATAASVHRCPECVQVHRRLDVKLRSLACSLANDWRTHDRRMSGPSLSDSRIGRNKSALVVTSPSGTRLAATPPARPEAAARRHLPPQKKRRGRCRLSGVRTSRRGDRARARKRAHLRLPPTASSSAVESPRQGRSCSTRFVQRLPRTHESRRSIGSTLRRRSSVRRPEPLEPRSRAPAIASRQPRLAHPRRAASCLSARGTRASCSSADAWRAASAAHRGSR